MAKLPRRPVPTRRDFLAKSAAAASAFGLAGCAEMAASTRSSGLERPVVAGKPYRQVGEGEPLRIGVIGTGGMGTSHVDSLLRLRRDERAQFDIVAAADVCQPRLDGALERMRGQEGVEVAGYRDYRELLAREDIHGVLIASPEHWHATHAVQALESGKDVYVEKPMTLDLDDALWLKRALDAAQDKIVQVGTQYMMRSNIVEARRLIAEGAIGQPVFSQTSYCRNTPDGEWNYYGIDDAWEPGVNLDWEAWCGPLGVEEWDPKVYARWRRYKKYSTGIIGDLLVHEMTPIIHALDLGFPTRVAANGGHYVDKEMENHDQVLINVEFGGQHTMLVAGSTCNDRGLETLIRGHRGDLLLGDGSRCRLQPQSPFVDEVDPLDIACEPGEWHDLLRLDWLNSMRTREPNRSTVDLGLKHMVVVDLATRSMWEGGAWEFDPETMQVSKV